jgi:hypothetical protein
MPKLPSPLLGYNNNVRHKGKVFHVQTEDSGAKYGHIITHLFMDGGRILKSVKTSYSEYIENDRMGEIVREMMKQQHKAMFIALRDGKFDSIIEGAEPTQSNQAFPAAKPVVPPSPASAPSVDAQPARPAGTPTAARALEAKRTFEGARTVEAPAARTPAPAQPVAVASSGFTPPPAPSRPVPEDDAPATLRGTMDSARSVDATGQAPDELAVDIEAVERAAAAASGATPALRGAVDLPPPPASLFREKTGAGKYRVTASEAPARAAAGPAAGRLPSSSPMPATAAAAGRPSTERAERRYAPTRPASIFGQARPQQGKSIFGEDLISDKSLDEVILSYLAEDLEGEKK